MLQLRSFALPTTTNRAVAKSKRLLQTVRKHLHSLGFVSFVDLGHLLELAHTSGRFGSEQVALARVHAEQLAGAGNLETLGGTAMGLKLQFRFRSIAWHCVNPSFFFKSSWASNLQVLCFQYA